MTVISFSDVMETKKLIHYILSFRESDDYLVKNDEGNLYFPKKLIK